MSANPADITQDGDQVNLQEFQTRLENSLGNIQALVETWLPKELRSAHTQSANQLSSKQKPLCGLDSTRPRNSKLGLGSAPPKHHPSQLTTSKLHSQLTKKPKTDLELGKVAEILPGHHLRDEESEEDSRASTIGRKRPAPSAASASSSFDLLLQPPSKLAKLTSSSPPPRKKKEHSPTSHPTPASKPSCNTNPPILNPHGLSKRQLKKMRKLERARSLAASTAASTNSTQSSSIK
ncbi:hypothetical protein VP01_1428g3 [Puccinia sorghi]|uniref:Uncharacterized protein n=1 Tax=Puccinia sorghi TaxID=27349 RepID=A0A0L6VKN9_9BASI|nr:hypothetical protein VP01_1428g3 [Puccinia sorghi]